jgi:YgiT-type zinc finger domain-containing protein
MTTMIRCSECEQGVLRPKTIEHDVGALLGMKDVRVKNLPALVCSSCGAVSIDGAMLDHLTLGLASVIVQQPAITGEEARFLRKLVGDTQSELAAKLGVDRVTVNRWENSVEPIAGAASYALRSHAVLRLLEKKDRHAVEKAAGALKRPASEAARVRTAYRLDAAAL